jgi:nucleotide-binding universal stress UspA family protein
LREASAVAARSGADNVDTVAEQADAVDLLIELIGRRGADVCVVGNRGLNSLAGRLLGSVPANISHRASCDVLIVHTTGGKR